MKYLMAMVLALSAFSANVQADHGKLRTLSRQLGVEGTRLQQEARRVIGNYPTYRQRYAYEHVTFAHNSSHRFEDIVFNGGMEVSLDDHAHDQLITRAYRQLESDFFNARKTFPDLFGLVADVTDDHPTGSPLDKILLNCEAIQREIYKNLPL